MEGKIMEFIDNALSKPVRLEIILFVLYFAVYVYYSHIQENVFNLYSTDVLISIILSAALAFICTVTTEAVILLIFYLHAKAESNIN
jgi:hypothetical protein